MARYVIDAPTLLYLVDAGLHVDPGHQLVAPNSIRSEALELLLRDVRAGGRNEAAALEARAVTKMKMRLLGDRCRAAPRGSSQSARLGHAQGPGVPRGHPVAG